MSDCAALALVFRLGALCSVGALVACHGGSASNGQTGSPGGAGTGTAGSPPERTCAEHDCSAEISRYYDRELGRREFPLSIIGAECIKEFSFDRPIAPAGEDFGEPWDRFVIRGPVCACQPDHDGGPYVIGADLLGCAVRGHAQDCLMEHGEIEPCDSDDPGACDSVCAELHDRFQADAMISKPFLVRSARCSEYEYHPDYVTTECSEAVIEIDGFCYDANAFPFDWNNWQSCELDDEQILSAARPVLPDCDDIPNSVPATADCRPACDDASTCRDAQGCDYGPVGSGFGRSGRGFCFACNGDGECLPNEVCVKTHCVLRDKADCLSDEGCPVGYTCQGSGFSGEGRGNETLEYRCGVP